MPLGAGVPPYTWQLAEFVDALTFAQLPKDVVEKAKSTLLDYLACAIGGSRWPHSQAALGLFLRLGGAEESTVIGTCIRTAADRAAFLNGMFGSSTPQMDDVYPDSYGHPGVGTHPAVLAVGERQGVSGRQAIVAIVAGYELAMRVGAAVGRDAFHRGWHPRAGCNVFGAAVASAKLLGLEGPAQYCAALGLAGNKASGLIAAAFFHDAWYTLSGNASADGVIAALFAHEGYDAGSTILESESGGYCRLVCDHPDWDRLTRDLGRRFSIVEIGQKRHASSGGTHAAIEAALKIASEHDLVPGDVAKVRVGGSRLTAETMGRPFPTNLLNATMSVPYLVAVSISDRQVLPEQYTDKKLNDPVLIGLQERTEVVLDQEMDRLYPRYLAARVEITTKGGSVYSAVVQAPRGYPEDPLTRQELEEKFRALSGGILTPSAVDRVLTMVTDLDRVPDIRVLTAALREVVRD